MNDMNILIAGAGELGSRYLQSMVSCRVPLKIHLHSNQASSLDTCRKRWLEASGTSSPHQVFYHPEISTLPDHFELVIASSTAHQRPQLVKSIAERSTVTYWVLEKILAQSKEGLQDILIQTGGAKKAWVNFYKTSQTWYQDIKSQLTSGGGEKMEVKGEDWGLACNSLHFLNLFSWLSGESLVSLDSSQLEKNWHKSKRPDNWEIFGQLVAHFSKGGKVTLTAESGLPAYSLLLSDSVHTWNIDEPSGIARRSDGLVVQGRVPYQSERRLVEDILVTGDCGLPSLQSVFDQHVLFISTMLEHWREREDDQADYVPIT
jgi:hypothetical protein